MEYVRIETLREAYAPNDERICGPHGTLTAGELRELLEDYPDDMPVVLSFDNGYTFGGISRNAVSEDSYGDDEY